MVHIVKKFVRKRLKKHIIFLVMITFMEIPVPISNTEVKHKCAKNTSELPCWEDRYCQEFIYNPR